MLVVESVTGTGGCNNPTAGLFLDLLRVAESKLLVL